MLCKYFQDKENSVDDEGYCQMPIGPLPLWLDDANNAVFKEECSKPDCMCQCYEVKNG